MYNVQMPYLNVHVPYLNIHIPFLNVLVPSVADPIRFISDQDPDQRIRFKKSGSYLDTFLMLNRINNILWRFLTKSKHLMTLKIKNLFMK